MTKEELYYIIQSTGIKIIPLAKIYEKENLTREELARWNSKLDEIIDDLNNIRKETNKLLEKEAK